MKLYLVRHGHAPTALEAGVRTDAERPLSEKGVAQARRAAQELQRRGCAPAALLTSPLKRAVQTAGIVAEALSAEPRVYAPLSNEISGAELLERLLADGFERPELVVVGHQPQLGECSRHLTGTVLELKPAGVIALEIPGKGPGKVLWTAAG